MKAIVVTVLSAIGIASGATTEHLVVTPTMAYGWTSASQSTATGSFVDGNAPAGFGSGSYRMTTGPGSGSGPGSGGKTWLSTNQHNGTKLADITSFSYNTFVAQGSPSLTIAVQLQVDLDGNGARDTTMVFEPVYSPGQGAVVQGQWQSWDLKAGTWWFTTNTVFGPGFNSFVPFADIVSSYPNAKIVQAWATPDGYGVQLVGGQNSAGAPWQNFDGNVDGLAIGVNDGSSGENKTVSDFELYSVPSQKDQCKNGGWMTFNPSFGPFKNQGDCVSFVATKGKSQ